MATRKIKTTGKDTTAVKGKAAVPPPLQIEESSETNSDPILENECQHPSALQGTQIDVSMEPSAVIRPPRRSCALCGLRKLADEYPLAKDNASRIIITCSACLGNIATADREEILDGLKSHNRLILKRKRSDDRQVSTALRKKAKKQRPTPPTAAECRICSETKPLDEFPKPTKKVKVVQHYPYGPPPPVSKTEDIPAACAAHLCARKSNKAGPVCKDCIGNSLAGSMSYKHAEQLGCPDENCGTAWDSTQYVSRYLSNEDFTAYSERLFRTYVATNKKILHCVNPSCGSAGLLDEQRTARRGLPQMECAECKTRFCANCRVEWHKDQTCQEYQIAKPEDERTAEELKSLKQLTKLNARRCPHCAYGVIKTDGCPNMICGNCHLSFYWDTAELVRAAPPKTSKRKTKSKKPSPAAPQLPPYYVQVDCEADTEAARARAAAADTKRA